MRFTAMFWRLATTLLLVALANAGRSVPETTESTTRLSKEPEGQGQGVLTTTSSIDSVAIRGIIRKVENSRDGDTYRQKQKTGGEVGNITGGEVLSKAGGEVPHTNDSAVSVVSGGEELNITGIKGVNVTDGEVSNITSGKVLNITDEEINIFTAHSNLSDIFIQNKSDYRPSLSSDTSHFVRDGEDEAKTISELDGSNASDLYYVNFERNKNGRNDGEMETIEVVQKGGEQFGGMPEKDKSSAIAEENFASLTGGTIKLSTIQSKNVTVKAILGILLNNLTQTTELHSPSSALILDALKHLGIVLQNITLSDNTLEDHEDIESNNLFTLGIFSLSLYNPAKGAYMGTKWERWDTGIPQGGLLAVEDLLETSSQVKQVIGVVVDGVTFRSAALLASHWNTTEAYTLLFNTRHFEHRRTIDAFLYDPEGDEKGVQVFWEPFSVAWRKVRCEVWVPGQGWYGGRCDPAVFDAGLVGCQCHGATFDEKGLRRARILIVEESETKDARADKKYFSRAALYLHDHKVDDNDLRDISKVVAKLLSFKPEFLQEHNVETLLDISAALHRIRPKNNESVLFAGIPGASLVVLDGDKSLDGLYLCKRWPTDNPEDAEFHATGLRPGGPSLESTSDTEVFAVRILGNVSLPRRTSLLLSSWEKKNALRRYFFKVFCFTQRFAVVAFSAVDEDIEDDGVEIVFEPSTKDWTNIHCSTWNFDSSFWNNYSCSSKSISSRLHSCKCPYSLFKFDNLLQARIHITEESTNRQNLVDWDLFNRTSHHLNHLAQLSLPGNQLSNVTAILDKYVLRKVRSNDYVLPSRVLDNLAAFLHRLVLDPNNPTAFSWQSDARSTAALFVKDGVDDSLATVAISETGGYVWNSTQNDITNTIVAVSFSSPQNGVGRVALTFITTTSRIQVEDRIIHRDRDMLDVTWRRTASPSISHDVIIHLKPFADTKRPVTIRSKTCRYWDFVRHDWSDGCTIRLDNDKELCECKIFPNNDSEIVHARFHIASDWSEQIVLSTSVPFFQLLTSELTLQMLIFHTGCALSLFGLVTVFVTALAFKSWRQRLSNKILLHICSALLLQILSVLFYYVVYHPFFFGFFDFVPEHREWTYLCLAMGLVWSYSYLARWCWMLVMSLLQLMRIVTVMGARNVSNLVLKVSIFAWGGPFILLGYFLSDPWAYFDDFNRRFYFLTYLLPLSVVLIANLAVFATILARAFACCGWGKMADLERHGANSWLSIWKRLRTVIVLFFTLEMTWLFELLIYFGYYNAFLHAMSFVVTAFHGFGTFVVFVVLDGDAQAGWRATLRSPRSWRKMALLYCLVLAIIVVALGVVVVVAVVLVCLHTLA